MARPLYRLLSPEGPQAKLLVFIFHRVVAAHDALLPAEPDADEFDWMMRFISRNFSVLSFCEAAERLRRGDLPASAACVTFDDGYRDNFTVALPILKRYGIVATFFIATGYVGSGRMWNDDIIEAIRVQRGEYVDWSEFGLDSHRLDSIADRLLAIDSVLAKLKYFPHQERADVACAIASRSGVEEGCRGMMNRDEIRRMRAAGMELGGHTHTHPILSDLSAGDAQAEIARGKEELEAILGETVTSFAYPNGNSRRDLGPRDAELVRQSGFRAAVTTDRGVARANTNPFLVPRFTPWERTPLRFALRCALSLAGSSLSSFQETDSE